MEAKQVIRLADVARMLREVRNARAGLDRMIEEGEPDREGEFYGAVVVGDLDRSAHGMTRYAIALSVDVLRTTLDALDLALAEELGEGGVTDIDDVAPPTDREPFTINVREPKAKKGTGDEATGDGAEDGDF